MHLWLFKTNLVLCLSPAGVAATPAKALAFMERAACSSLPWVEEIPWWRKWQPTPVFLPGELDEQKSLAGYSPWVRKASDVTEYSCTTHIMFEFSEKCSETHCHLHCTVKDSGALIGESAGAVGGCPGDLPFLLCCLQGCLWGRLSPPHLDLSCRHRPDNFRFVKGLCPFVFLTVTSLSGSACPVSRRPVSPCSSANEMTAPLVSLGRKFPARVHVLGCVWLCSPVDCSPAGSSVHEIFQARLLEWVAISLRESFLPKSWTHLSCIVRQILYH